MKTIFKYLVYFPFLILAFNGVFSITNAVQAASTDLADVPMAVKNSVTPNVLVVLDNSQSMDGQMGGVLISGNDPTTRGNIGRLSMRNAITKYKDSFNWGLMSFQLADSPSLYSTYVYLMGTNTTMVFTNTCTGYVPGTFNGAPFRPGLSNKSNPNGGLLRCVANPEPFSGGNYITFEYSSDDPKILDVLYSGGYTATPTYAQMWAPAVDTANPTTYKFYSSRSGTNWTWSRWDRSVFATSLSATDAGFTPANYAPWNISRSIYLPRGWGYNTSITGKGILNEPVQTASATHDARLIALLGNETNGSTPEIKNAATFTPTTGTLQTAKDYFSGSSSPAKYSCQQNFIMLVTDGLPTATTSGQMYTPPPNTTNTCAWSTVTNSCTSGSLGQAARDAVDAVKNLRSVAVPAVSSTRSDGSGSVTGKFDIQTYVVALASTVGDNPQNMAVMNAMASAGGGMSKALLASDTVTFDNAMTAITDDVTAKTGSSAAVAVANAHVTSSDNASYASSFNSGTWTGDLNAYPVNLSTGAIGQTSLWVNGSAQDQLDARTAANRKIVTAKSDSRTGGVAFQSATISAAQLSALNTPSVSPADGASVLAYLRGDRSGEQSFKYRARAHLLGDMVNAEPVVVRSPSANYNDAGYAAFKASNSQRKRMVYQGANDGMLHAFDGLTGEEAWAYVPNLVIPNLNKLTKAKSFVHTYFVDGTPVVGDVDFSNTGSAGASGDWRTILVSGLAKGGRGFFALDVTNPAIRDETDAATKVLWEFPNSIINATTRAAVSKNMGYSYGKPIIVKTKASGWVVLLTSGYNNGSDTGGDGLGHLYVINPKTGDLIKDIPTTACTSAPTSNPCGLAQVAAYVDNYDLDNTTEYVYGGDLKGNVWRFNLSSDKNKSSQANIIAWSGAKFAVLRDASGVLLQPVTTQPELASINGTRIVYIGTGQYLGDSDVPGSTVTNTNASQVQTMYGLKDSSATTLPDPLRPALVQQNVTTSGNTRTTTKKDVNFTSGAGWYVELQSTGERLNTNPVLFGNVLSFVTNVPSTTVCVPGGQSWLYFLDFKTGATIENAPAQYLGKVMASRPVPIQLPNKQVLVLTRTSDGTTPQSQTPIPVPPATNRANTITWRELIEF